MTTSPPLGPAEILGAGFDFTDPGLLSRGLPLDEFVMLRRTCPVWWNEQDPDNGGGFHDGGYWVIYKHAHIREISRDPDTWTSHLNGCVTRYANNRPAGELEAAKILIHNSDPPVHTRLRKLVTRLFTPRHVAQLDVGLKAAAYGIDTAAAKKSEGDFVVDIAHKLPLKAIADLVGFPESDQEKLFHWSGVITAVEDPDCAEDPQQAMVELMGYAYEIAAQRKHTPAEDIVTRLVTADADGDQLTEIEFGYFILLLVIAGFETTRNATSAGMQALLSHPDQWNLYKQTRPATAADEIIRWSSPVDVFQRTACRDTEIGGVPISAGQRVGLFYGSANYDEDVFTDPFVFDIQRDPNPHLGFGGTGSHYCLGAALARREVTIIFNAVADHLPDLEIIGPPRRMRHG